MDGIKLKGDGQMKKSAKKPQIKGFVAGVLLATMLFSTALVAASQSGVMREAFYGVNIVINGNEWNPPSDMTPFISDGRTFLPVRGIAETLGIPVDWDGATSTVYVGTIPHGAPFYSTVPPFERGGDRTGSLIGIRVGTVNMQGNPFANALKTNSAPGFMGGRYGCIII